MFQKGEVHKIIRIFQTRLLCCVLVAFLITSIFLVVLQFGISNREVYNLLQTNISDVMTDIGQWSSEMMHSVTDMLAEESLDDINLEKYVQENPVSELSIVDDDGVVTDSSNTELIGSKIADADTPEEMLEQLVTVTWTTKVDEEDSYSEEIPVIYLSSALSWGGYIQVGFDEEASSQIIDYEVIDSTKNRHIRQNGFLLITDLNGNIISDLDNINGDTLSEIGLELDLRQIKEDKIFSSKVNGANSVCMYERSDNYYYIAVLPKSEAYFTRNLAILLALVIEILIFGVLYLLIYYMMRKLVVENINRINGTLAQITAGNLDETVEAADVEEFMTLSTGINQTVETLKEYITKAEQRNAQELAFAEQVQKSALPNVFPPYPERKDLDLFAEMFTAKEVGGDFYDFYFVGEDKLAFLIADVSGKGIPAAMFMMRAKTLLKGLAESCQDAGTALTKANDMLCEENDANMFVTAWMGILDFEDGILRFANAGHNRPLICRNGGSFEWLNEKPGFVLAGMPGIKYQTEELQLQTGDVLFLYTDGVTEATNTKEELYGDDRLQSRVNSAGFFTAKQLCVAVKEDVDDFVKDAPQFDDLTMLTLCYLGGDEERQEITVDATTENIDTVTEFVNNKLEQINCPMKVQTQVDIAIDELFGNIANYAYPSTVGLVRVSVEKSEDSNSVIVTLMDQGVPYNPLAKPDPDVKQTVEEREIGGLGIYLSKNIMDNISYEYKNGKNILRIEKNL